MPESVAVHRGEENRKNALHHFSLGPGRDANQWSREKRNSSQRISMAPPRCGRPRGG